MRLFSGSANNIPIRTGRGLLLTEARKNVNNSLFSSVSLNWAESRASGSCGIQGLAPSVPSGQLPAQGSSWIKMAAGEPALTSLFQAESRGEGKQTKGTACHMSVLLLSSRVGPGKSSSISLPVIYLRCPHLRRSDKHKALSVGNYVLLCLVTRAWQEGTSPLPRPHMDAACFDP